MKKPINPTRFLVSGICLLLAAALDILLWAMGNAFSWWSVASFICFLAGGTFSMREYLMARKKKGETHR